ncbi:MAG: methylmalonyl-CoA mutase [Chloroflexi bacterium]|nr:methylmalonyl-CoA mutase [Chloroflexota bacterium]|tara:strand:- start:1907 stop:2317 length:411 start_codon:yes stop_codon:yes gene_type:complete
MRNSKPPKILLAKLGLDGHDRGIKVIAKSLENAGMEVIYMGMRVTPEQVVNKAQEEDADVIGISLLSGAHKTLMERLMKVIHEREMSGETLVLLGGTVADSDIEPLKSIGVDGVFPVGSSLNDIENFINENLKRQE